MPCYNEQAAIETVIRSWFSVLDSTLGDFHILALNDGSTDQTEAILNRLSVEFGPRLEIITRSNHGHGQTCIAGYHLAIARKIPFILQIDSDGQSDPAYFPDFWKNRTAWNIIYGKRTRQDGFRRILASFILRNLLRILVKAECTDANVPYRLMDTAACAPSIQAVPPGIHLSNIALAVILKKDPSVRHGEIPIGFPPRMGGEPSVPFWKFAGKGFQLFAQLKKAGIR